MIITPLLAQLHTTFEPSKSKLHLATSNSVDNPLDVYLAGAFDEWQSLQSTRNFERPYVLSLISLPETNSWLFAGLYHVEGSSELPKKGYKYQMTRVAECDELAGRLVVSFRRPGRNSYLKTERWSSELLLSAIRPTPLSVREFPGFKNIDLSSEQLQVIAREAPGSWRSPLSNVAGVYLITATNLGKLYVGSATGEGGIWARWLAYADELRGHGGNKELRRLLDLDPAHKQHWRFSLLEIADVGTSEESMLARESHWKNVLLTRTHGLNKN